jgi:hypothetical protein
VISGLEHHKLSAFGFPALKTELLPQKPLE